MKKLFIKILLQRIGEQRKAEQQLLSMSNAAPANLLKPVNGQLFEGMDTNQPFYDRGNMKTYT